MVGSGRGGWDVPMSSYEWQFLQMRNGRGILVFDDGWHKLATALWLFGPVVEVRAWIGRTEVVPGIAMDAPTTISWEHANGIRGVWDITLATDMYLRSDYYTNDERWEVTGRRGYARVNRCTGRGVQQPSLEVYADGELTQFHALDDDWGSSFRESGRHWLRWLHTGDGPLWWSGEDAVDVLRFALGRVREQRGRRHRHRPEDGDVDAGVARPPARRTGGGAGARRDPGTDRDRPRGAGDAHERLGARGPRRRTLHRLGDPAHDGRRARRCPT